MSTQIGERMLDEIDEDVALDPISNRGMRRSLYSSISSSHRLSVPHSMPRTARSSLSTVGSTFSDGMSLFASPTPVNRIAGLSIARHSIEPQPGDSARPSFDSDDGRRPSIDSIPQMPSVRPEFVAQLEERRLLAQKQSTASTAFTYESVNSSPCPRPPRRKLLMLTGNKLPRAPLRQPLFKVFGSNSNSADSPEHGRVKNLKAAFEARSSPDKASSPSSE